MGMNEEQALTLVKTLSQWGQSLGQPGDFGYDLGASTEQTADQMLSQVKYDKYKKEQEKQKKSGQYGKIGSVVGSIIGSTIAPGVGTVIGSTLGETIGSTAGGGDAWESFKGSAINAGTNLAVSKLTNTGANKAAEVADKGTEKPDVEPIKIKAGEDIAADTADRLTIPSRANTSPTGAGDIAPINTKGEQPGFLGRLKQSAGTYLSDPQNVSNLISLVEQATTKSEPAIDTRGLSPEAADRLTTRVAQERQLQMQGLQTEQENKFRSESGAREEKQLGLEERRLNLAERPQPHYADVPILDAAGVKIGSRPAIVTTDTTGAINMIPIPGVEGVAEPEVLPFGGVFIPKTEVAKMPLETQYRIQREAATAEAAAVSEARLPAQLEAIQARGAIRGGGAAGARPVMVQTNQGLVPMDPRQLPLNAPIPGTALTLGEQAQDTANLGEPQKVINGFVSEALLQGGYAKVDPNGMLSILSGTESQQTQVAYIAAVTKEKMRTGLEMYHTYGIPTIRPDRMMVIIWRPKVDRVDTEIGMMPSLNPLAASGQVTGGGTPGLTIPDEGGLHFGNE